MPAFLRLLHLLPLTLLAALLTLLLAACQQPGLPSPTPEPLRPPAAITAAPTATAAPTTQTRPAAPPATPAPTAAATTPAEQPRQPATTDSDPATPTRQEPLAEADKTLPPRELADLARAMAEAMAEAAQAGPSAAADSMNPNNGSPPQPPVLQPRNPADTTFKNYQRSPVVQTAQDPVSTFSLDADRASYQLALAWSRQGHPINPSSVRAEEWINAFDYDYEPPRSANEFAIASALTDHPLDPEKALLRLSFQAPELPTVEQPLNVTLVMDASGSMAEGDRLAIAKHAAETLRQSLRPQDRLAVVQFDQSVVDETGYHPPETAELAAAFNRLIPGGSTNVQAGLNRGLQLAAQIRERRPEALNYVILCSDGVANVDATNPFAILDNTAWSGDENPIRLIAIGVGISNYNDYLLEQLAQHGNGWYRYLDSPAAARQLFQRDSWLNLANPFADQARAQVTWNPEQVKTWRIIGYENRVAPDHHFDQNRREFAELPAGAAVTVFYELELTSHPQEAVLGQAALRWVDPQSGQSREQVANITDGPYPPGDYNGDYDRWLDYLKFGAIVALAADRYSALSPPGPPALDPELPRQVHRELQTLGQELKKLAHRPLAQNAAWQDFQFLLNRLTASLPPAKNRSREPEGRDKLPKDSGYSR